MSLQPPNLLSPNGNEVFTQRQINISWENVSESVSSHPKSYEIFFTDDFVNFEKTNWVQIAVVNDNESSFLWDIPFSIKGNNCRVAIRTRDFRGDRSKLSVSANDFEIESKMLKSPSVFSPSSGKTYFSYIPFILDHSALLGTASQRSFYRIYYSSKSLDIDWTIVTQDLPVGSEVFYWDVRGFASSTDYSFKVELVEGENVSNPVIIDNIKINSFTFFVFDTVPPKGDMSIEGPEFTNQRDIVINVSAFDLTTDIKSIIIKQADDTFDNITTEGAEQGLDTSDQQSLTWQITGEDGAKYIQAYLKDFGNNIFPLTSEKKYFRKLYSDNNEEITAIEVNNNNGDVWFGVGPKLYKNGSLIETFDNQITSLAFFRDVLYIGLKTDSDKGILKRIINNNITTVDEFTENESIINRMVGYNSKLYLGFENGDLYLFNGTSISSVSNLGNSIINLSTDNAVLYIFLQGVLKFVIYDETTFTDVNVD